MEPRYARPASPGSRRLVQPGRSSAGTLIYPPGYDPYYAPTRTSRDSMSGPRTSAERIIVPRTTARPYRDDTISSRRVPDDYSVSPRRSTLDPISAAGRRPLNVVATGDSNRYRPVITSASEKPASPYKPRLREVEPHYILPASSSRRDHHRTYSADNPDATRYLSDGRERLERGGYRSSGVGGGRQGYNLNMPLVKQPKDKEDQDYGYEYTDRKEQMYRDTAPRLRARRGSDGGRRERPLSMTGLEDYPPRLSQVSRDSGPPVSTRGFSKLESTTLDRSGSLRHEYRIPRQPDPVPRDSVPTISRDESDTLQRRKSNRAPVALHQDPDDGYSSYREDRKEPRSRHYHSSHRTGSLDRGGDDRGLAIRIPEGNDARRDSDERNRKHHDSASQKDREEEGERDKHHRNGHRVEVDDRDLRARDERRKDKHGENKVGGDLALGAAGVAAAGLVAEGVKHRHHRDREPAGVESETSVRDRRDGPEPGRLAVNLDPSESSSRSGENSDEERRERRRRRHREKEAREDEELREEPRKGRFDELAPPNDDQQRESASYDRGARIQPVFGSDNLGRRHRRHHHRTSDEASHSESSVDDDGRDAYQFRPSVVRVVSPARDDRTENKPKGILRPPREKFPEDPAPVREGVAPLKDAGKKGIPPNARWTKIDRKLVNPEALDQGNERYEERIDYVIVLRVLTKEEIEAYAERTQEIRGKRTSLVEDEANARFQEDRRLRLKAIEDAERKLEREPALRIDNHAYEERIDKGHRGSHDRDMPRERGENSLPYRGAVDVQTIQPRERQETLPPPPPPPQPPTQRPVLPSISSDSSLKEDPMRPGTYSGYQRNPPPPATQYPQPAMQYPPPPPLPPKVDG
ncbi:hypothetical protein MMC11_007602 [Xylographa trunciseda]|nr:hypothetical protein [Xylographa trunciseda]